MFPSRYFSPRYFATRFWPPILIALLITLPGGGSPSHAKKISIEQAQEYKRILKDDEEVLELITFMFQVGMFD